MVRAARQMRLGFAVMIFVCAPRFIFFIPVKKFLFIAADCYVLQK
jgi:hypothetical protein